MLNEERKRRQESPLFPEYPPQTPKRIVEAVGELVLGLIQPSISAPSTLVAAQSGNSNHTEAFILPSTAPHESASTLVARKLAVFGYATLALAILAGGFTLGSFTGNRQIQRLNLTAQTTKSCNFKADYPADFPTADKCSNFAA